MPGDGDALLFCPRCGGSLERRPLRPGQSGLVCRLVAWPAIRQILDGYRQGTRYNIKMDIDGLISGGMPGIQLTWMDAKIGDWVVTPRHGKPVEIQALWLRALQVGARLAAQFGEQD